MIYYEDCEVGEFRRFGSCVVTREETIEFATRFDPQPFHLDDDAAAATHFGRLSASGWHTAAMTMRMWVDDMAREKRASLGSPGIDKLRWLKPVFPGDVLSAETELLEKRRSRSRPEMGILSTRMATFNQSGDKVLEMYSAGLIAVRDPAAPID